MKLTFSMSRRFSLIENREKQSQKKQILISLEIKFLFSLQPLDLGKFILQAMKNIFLALILIIFLFFRYSLSVIVKNPQSFSLKFNSSTLSTQVPDKFYAGQIHFSRIPVQYWEHRILMIKALGLNALSVYVMWNHHQIERGQFDFTTENKNLPLFLELAEKHNMSVLLRPGPYSCAEWDFGGFPARLYSVPNLKIRSNNPQYLNEVKIYFAALAPIIKKHIKTESNPKGSIFLLQIQNQYGSYGEDLNYINALRKIWEELDVQCEQYHEDGTSEVINSHWSGANVGLSGGTKESEYQYVKSIQRKGVVFGGEIYTGWLTHWGEEWQKTSTAKNIEQFTFLITHNHSFSMYMVHGGTNFGLTAGANAGSGKSDYTAHVTSYDYDSPINEQGAATSKYHALRQLLSKYVDWNVPDVPAPIKMIEIPRFRALPLASMLLNLRNPLIQKSQKYYPFESNELKMYNQGFVVYQTTLNKRTHYFKATIRDFAVVVLDDVHVASLDRSISSQHNFTIHCQHASCNLKIIIQAMGHINYAHEMDNDIKGLFNISDDLGFAFTWNMYRVPIDISLFQWGDFNHKFLNQPTLFSSVLQLQTVGDTYFDMNEFTKGYLFVNGRNLGRYWNRGPQKRLYCPGVWLKTGNNNIYVLQILYDGKQKGITGKLSLQQPLNLIVQE